MKIWIDITNSPHVNFFEYLIKDLINKHEIILTCRSLANTIELLNFFKFTYHVIGKHYGRNWLKKGCGFNIRVWQLFRFLRKKKVDVAISHSSFYSPLVAKLIRSRCIYINDNEHASGNRLSFIFADKILVPECVDQTKFQAQWAKLNKIIKYPGLKEGIYLWNYEKQFLKPIDRKNSLEKKTVYIRPEPSGAQYYKGKKNFIDDLLIGLKSKVSLVLLPRSKEQEIYYQKQKFKPIYIPKKPIHLSHIFHTCDLFIGAGGTMTREAAILGIPTISIYQGKLLDVDKYLINAGFMVNQKQITAEHVLNYLAKAEKNPPDQILLKKGRAAYHLVRNLILENSDSCRINSLEKTFDLFNQ